MAKKEEEICPRHKDLSASFPHTNRERMCSGLGTCIVPDADCGAHDGMNGAVQIHQSKVLPCVGKLSTQRWRAGDKFVGIMLPIAMNYTMEGEKEIEGVSPTDSDTDHKCETGLMGVLCPSRSRQRPCRIPEGIWDDTRHRCVVKRSRPPVSTGTDM